MTAYTFNHTEQSRESNKKSLNRFTFDKYNFFDSPIDRVAAEIKRQINEKWQEHDNWFAMQEHDPQKFNDLNELAERTGHSLSIQMHDYIDEIGFIEEELYALYEMKIIYTFKHLEINLKKLLSASYNDKSVNRQFNWDNLKQYVNSKGIEMANINGYAEMNQLRQVNNFLKHSSNEDLQIKKIVGVNPDERIDSDSLEKFYSEIEKIPNIFLKSLADSIYEDLYAFDENKLTAIASSFALRMDEKTAKEMAEKLLDLYR